LEFIIRVLGVHALGDAAILPVMMRPGRFSVHCA
jgi:hypothetical protein